MNKEQEVTVAQAMEVRSMAIAKGVTSEGRAQACYVWWNGTNRKVNLNWVSNYGNANKIKGQI